MDLLGLKHRTIAKNPSLLRTQFVMLLPELPANVSGLAVWQGWRRDSSSVSALSYGRTTSSRGLKYRMNTCGWSKSYAWRAGGSPALNMMAAGPVIPLE